MKRKYDTTHLVDNTPMLMPDADAELVFEDREDSSTGVDQGGYLHRTILRYDVRKWIFSYAFLTKEEYEYIRMLFRNKAAFSFTFTNDFGEIETVNAYCVPSSVVYQSKRSGLYKNLRLEINEC